MYKYFLILTIVLFSCESSDPAASMASQSLEKFINTMGASAGWGGLAQGNDFSTESFEASVNAIEVQLSALQEIDTSDLSFEEKIDWKFAKSILIGRKLEKGNMKYYEKDPRQYMAFRSISNTIGQPGDLEKRIAAVGEKLSLIPKQLKNGQEQIKIYVPRFQELSLFMAEKSESLFKEEVPKFINTIDEKQGQKLASLNDKALLALASYVDYIKNDLPKLPEGHFSIGEETYDQMLESKFLLDYTSEELYNFGLEQFEKTKSELTELAKKIDPEKTWQQLIIEVKNKYPHPDSMIQAHQYWVNKSRDHILENDLLPIPWEEKVTVVPRAEYLRKTSYYGNFSRAKGKNKDGIFEAQWMINPFEHQWDDETKAQYMVEHDWGVIIVTAPHEAYAGHHIHGLYQMHNPSKLRRENGISLFSEGWGLYNEQLMMETGFFPSDSIYLRQLQLRLWRNARVIYDTGMHTDRLSYEDAISLMEDKVGFLRWAAQLEIDGATSRPGYYIGYFLGMHQILQMREDYKAKMGKDYSIKDFHIKLMEAGNMPNSLMREVVFHGL